MRNIDNICAANLLTGSEFKNGNSEVVKMDYITNLFLHRNLIADFDRKKGLLTLWNRGYFTQTTKARLNGILTIIGESPIEQIKGIWYFNNKPFKEGMQIKVNDIYFKRVVK